MSEQTAQTVRWAGVIEGLPCRIRACRIEGSLLDRIECPGMPHDRTPNSKRRTPPDVASILEAFIQPLHAMASSGNECWNNWTRLVAQIAQTNRWLVLVQRHFDETAKMFVSDLCRACPHRSRAWIVRSFMFAISVMVGAYTGSRRGSGILGEDTAGPQELQDNYAAMIAFLAAGFESTDPPKRRRTRHVLSDED